MQIKRFEAADMTEALRMVKREFGDDAVILSAKEVRPGGFFSALRKKSVEITAAADYPVADAQNNPGFSGLLSQQLDDNSPTDRVSLSTSSPSPKTDFGKARPPATQPGVTEPETDHLIADPFYGDAKKRQIIALVGPPGVGKSTTLAKLARHCRGIEKRRTGLISLDRFRIGANSMLERVAHIMNLPLAIVHDAGQLQQALHDLADADVVLIDTPGMGPTDLSMLDDVGALLRLANPDETHLAVNATVREDLLADMLETFLPVGVNRLLFTHMDEYGSSPAILNLLKEARLPSSFYADGVDLFDHLQETVFDRLSEFCCQEEETDCEMTVFPAQGDPLKTASVLKRAAKGSLKYVANRNSELFHHPHCKSVKRINAENITAFNSIEQAVEEGFKPCRACCNISMIGKSMMGEIGLQRVSAL